MVERRDDIPDIHPLLGEFTDVTLEARYRQAEVHRCGRHVSFGLVGLSVAVMLVLGLYLDLSYFTGERVRFFPWLLGFRLVGVGVALGCLWAVLSRAPVLPTSFYWRLLVGVLAVGASYTAVAYLYKTQLGWSASPLWLIAMLLVVLLVVAAPLRYTLLVVVALVVMGVLLHGMLLSAWSDRCSVLLMILLNALVVGSYLSLRFNVVRRREFAVVEHVKGNNRELVAEVERRWTVEEELRRHQENLEEQVRACTDEKLVLEGDLQRARRIEALGRMAGGVAHDFNNLLGPILDATETARAVSQSQGDVTEDLDIIQAAAERARALTGQLLAFGREKCLTLGVVDMHRLVRRVVGLLGRMLPPGIRLALQLEATRTRVRGDESQLEMILLNLALNARDAMPDGGELILHTTNWKSRLVIEVVDTGLGMDAEIRARIFKPFYTTKQGGQGTGLGLANAFGVVTQHQGTITVDSSPGLGSIFRIELPVTRKDLEIAEPEDPAARDEEQPAAGIPDRTAVLLVDDEELARKSISRNLSLRGFNVMDAASGEEALRLAREMEGSIQILITDMVMPGMSGRELWKKLRAELPSLHVIFTSGYTDDMVGIEQLQQDHAFLQKPFSTKDLVALIEQIIGS